MLRLVVLLVAILQLIGCSGVAEHHPAISRDYAPNFHIDVSKIHNAVPKPEPLSKYGNPVSYVACGQRYTVKKSSSGYREKGIASWYGMKFHKKRTSSGDPYNVAGMTAAHKTLPLPTYCLVTNLQSGKHIIVKVNDRGPFVPNRIIDLSYAAAVKLGVTPCGTALVEVKAIDPYHPERVLKGVPQRAPIHLTSHPHLYLQMGAFSIRGNAEKLAQQVSECISCYKVVIKEGELTGSPLYRVQIGPVPTVDDSDAIYQELKAAGLGKPIAVVQ